MIELSSYFVFLVASVSLILIPGPAQALVIATSLRRGPREGALTALGLNIGTLFHTMAAGLGLSAILASSALAFSIVKYVGAAYLLYVGIRALRSKPAQQEAQAGSVGTGRSALGQAVLAGVLNPKVALFFLAFLPQFVDPARGAVLLQFFILGVTIAALDTLYELMIVHLVCRMKGRFLRDPRLQSWRNRFSGIILILLGLRLAVQER
jgi:threonine/homoserine/homoserine lactone efflux protein